MATDKTQVFHDQIQAKQKELQPWTAQINTKQAEIDVATSERDALAKKAQALQAASKEAGETLEALQEDLQTKVIQKNFTKWLGSFTSHSKVSKQDELKDEKRTTQNNIQVAQKKIKVGLFYCSILLFLAVLKHIFRTPRPVFRNGEERLPPVGTSLMRPSLINQKIYQGVKF